MALERIANLRGPQGLPGADGDKGDPGTFAHADAVTVAAGESASVEMYGPQTERGARFFIPRGLPGVEAVPTDEAVATMVAASDTDTGAAVRARVWEMSPHVNVRAYGAVGDGVTDDGPALQAAIDAAAAFGAATLLPAGTYRTQQTLHMASNSTLRGDGATTIDYTGVPKSGSARYGIRATGTLGTARPLTATTARGDISAQVDTDGIEVGDWVLVSTSGSNFYPYGGTTNVDRGEMKRVQTVGTASVTFEQALYDTYAPEDNATLTPVEMVENVAVEGVHIVGSDVPAEGERAIQFDYVNGFRITGCTIEGADIYCVQLRSCIRGDVSGNRMIGVEYLGSQGSVFYGVSLANACQWVRVANNHAERVRHLFVTSANNAGQGHWGMPRFITCVGNVAQNMQGTSSGRSWAFEHHGFGDAILIANNVADGCFGGFVTRGPGVTFEGNIVRNWHTYALQIHSQTVDARNIIIRNNQVSDRIIEGGFSGAVAVRAVLPANVQTHNVVIEGNVLTIDRAQSANNGAGVHITGGDGGITVKGNTIAAEPGMELDSALIVVDTKRADIVGNRLSGSRRGIIAAEEAIVKDNVITGPDGDYVTSAIFLRSAVDALVQGNTTRGFTRSILVDSYSTGSSLISNYADGAATDPFVIFGSGGTLARASGNVWREGQTAVNDG